MEDECADYQQCEMEALAAIYADTPAFTFTDTKPISGSIAVEVDTSDATDSAQPKYLPPIYLHFVLPALYPLVDAPRISLECSWLSAESLAMIEKQLGEIWRVEGGMCVLDSYANHLRHELGSFTIGVSSLPEVTAYNERRVEEVFGMQTFLCMICMERQSGRHCVELGCTHVHCVQCLREYWGMLIDEGSVWMVRCPHPGCPQPITEDEMGRVLDRERVRRYGELSEQRRVDMDSTHFAWCPREGCGRWGARDKLNDKLCICSCGYAFCVCCRRVWHGTSFCAIDSRMQVLEEYRRALEDGIGLEAMQKRYGKAVLESMLEREEKESESLRFIETVTRACPTCGVRIVKAYGCNHIRCTQCNSHFCYLCGELFGRADPLAHFRVAGTGCYLKLLEGVLGDQADPEEVDDLI
ncbi:hypothetical protein H4218_004866 [Coemansia sp. IMI 209128]|nr:hypothetical protein GGI10_000085 [Coemansia sp. RSA 2530]KAJ2696023.1 hypothetical protein H4218_004866 [Coemansia sp. IMI 209128]